MITLWLNKKNFVDPSFTINMHLGRFPDSVSLEDLKPGITVDTDDLGDAFGLCQNLDSPDDDSRIVRGNRDRSASVGDILQKSDNTCWFIAPGHGFQPLQQQLPHVAKSHWPEDDQPFDPFESFPTLDLDWETSKSISRIDLPSFLWLETLQWPDGSTRQLLRQYK